MRIKTTVIPIFVIVILFAGYFISTNFDREKSGDNADVISGRAEIIEHVGLPVKPLVLKDQTVEFPYTDDNMGETLIIKSDRKLYYDSSSRSDVFISITNTGNIEQDLALLFYFPGDQKAEPATLELFKDGLPAGQAGKWEYVVFYKNNIKVNQDLLDIAIKKRETIPKTVIPKAGAQIHIPASQTIYLKTIITYEPETEGEFWIEALGSKGSYGLLDPTYGTVRIRGGLGRGLNLLSMFNGSGTDFPGGSPASGGFDDYNNGGAPPSNRYVKVWTACTAGNSYCGTGDSGAYAKDNSTQLVWSLPCNGSGCSSFSDASPLTYSWSNGGANNNSRTAYQLCSDHSGWYLPHQKQLMQAYIDGSYGNLEASGVIRSYWSATTLSFDTTYAWYVILSYGSTNYDIKTNGNFVRCVRSAS